LLSSTLQRNGNGIVIDKQSIKSRIKNIRCLRNHCKIVDKRCLMYLFRCGPCQGIAPFFAKLSDEYRQVVFLKVDVDECQEIAMASNVAAMPTFVFLKDGSEVDRMQGANPNELEAKIKSLAGSAGAAASFEGSGHRLGGTAAATPPASVDKAGLKQLEEQAQALVGADESKPTTKVNVRLADGNK
jgi:thioredoxin-like negative regulator of GroEL